VGAPAACGSSWRSAKITVETAISGDARIIGP
jgi:hypothetical protein